MKNSTHTTQIPFSTLLVVIGISLVAGFAIVYLTLTSDGNGRNTASPPAAPRLSSASGPASSKSVSPGTLAGTNRGEMSAFLVHKKPVPMPEFEFFDVEGKRHTLAAWKGKIVLLNLWATWCAPCRKEMPDMDKLQGQLGSDDFKLVPLNVDHGGLAKPKNFFKQLKVKHLTLYGGKGSVKLTGKLRAPGLPTTILINRQGMEIGRLVGPAHWGSPDAVNLIRAAMAQQK